MRADKSKLKRIALYSVCAALLAAAGMLSLLFPQQMLCVESGDVHADALVVLGGGFGDRAARAAKLFQQGSAPKIIVSGSGDCTINLQLLTNAGVPASAIQLESGSKTTRENAESSVSLLRADGVRRAIVVTSWYHSRRALMCFRHYAPEIKFYSRPSYSDYARSTWSRAGIWHDVRAEYVKISGYWLCYGICPF
jgi:uncharacterized SAM-binding protein YcdF (DUF218 family)